MDQTEKEGLSKTLSRDLLRARAEIYARQEEKTVAKGTLAEFLCFRLGRDGYLIEARWIEEIVRLARISKLPRQKEFLRGILNVRGNLVPVADLSVFLGLPETPGSEQSRVILIRDGSGLSGIIAADILGYFKLDTGQAQETVATIRGPAAEYTKGFFHHLDQPFVWLHTEKILSDLSMRMRLKNA
jgi:purine-binding chemotaxis protein CheW